MHSIISHLNIHCVVKRQKIINKQTSKDDPINAIIRRVSKGTDEMISNLQQLIREPSVSAKGQGLESCAKTLSDMLIGAGLHSEILYLNKSTNAAPPIVYAEILSKTNPTKTLLFYNHYDVQPEEPLEQWRYPPFEGVKKGNKVYGRGAIDDKGEIVARLCAVKSYVKEMGGDIPCNIKFLIEGEEEIGSNHITQYMKKYRRKFTCDAVIWEFGYVSPDCRPIVGLGMKGLMFVELSARGPVRDAHSSLAVLIKNPAWRLVQALHAIRRETDGRILIRGWYDDVKDLSATDLKLLRAEPFDEEQFKKEYGIRDFVGGVHGMAAKKALAATPTCNIAGIISGYTASGAKTVLPAIATVKLDFRLVPEMIPQKQFKLLKKHLASTGFSDICATMLHAESAARTDPTNLFVCNVADAAESSFQATPILNVSNPATGPMYAFTQVLGNIPCVSVGGTHVYSKIHSPNEFARIDLLKKTAKCMCYVIDNFGRFSSTQEKQLKDKVPYC